MSRSIFGCVKLDENDEVIEEIDPPQPMTPEPDGDEDGVRVVDLSEGHAHNHNNHKSPGVAELVAFVQRKSDYLNKAIDKTLARKGRRVFHLVPDAGREKKLFSSLSPRRRLAFCDPSSRPSLRPPSAAIVAFPRATEADLRSLIASRDPTVSSAAAAVVVVVVSCFKGTPTDLDHFLDQVDALGARFAALCLASGTAKRFGPVELVPGPTGWELALFDLREP